MLDPCSQRTRIGLDVTEGSEQSIKLLIGSMTQPNSQSRLRPRQLSRVAPVLRAGVHAARCGLPMSYRSLAMLLIPAAAINEMPDIPRLCVMAAVKDIRRFDDNRRRRHSGYDEANPLDTPDKRHCLALLGKSISVGSGNTLPRTLTSRRPRLTRGEVSGPLLGVPARRRSLARQTSRRLFCTVCEVRVLPAVSMTRK